MLNRDPRTSMLLVRWLFPQQPLRYPRLLHFYPNSHKVAWCKLAQLLYICRGANRKTFHMIEYLWCRRFGRHLRRAVTIDVGLADLRAIRQP